VKCGSIEGTIDKIIILRRNSNIIDIKELKEKEN